MVFGGSVGIRFIKLSYQQQTTTDVANVTRAYALAFDSVLSRVSTLLFPVAALANGALLQFVCYEVLSGLLQAVLALPGE